MQTLNAPAADAALMSFEALNLLPSLLSAVSAMGYEKPSSIQAAAIPTLLAGQDVIGQAQTGSGKTAAFAIPVIQNLMPNARHVQALILCPTRELVLQVAQQVEQLMQFSPHASVAAVYGGEDIRRQLQTLKQSPSVVVGTPGRTMDLMDRNALDLSGTRMVVLDEADEMLDMGFRDDMETILSEIPAEQRQTVLFSATMEATILQLAKTFQKNPTVINVCDEVRSQPNIEQCYSVVPESHKKEAVYRLLIANSARCSVVFCNTKAKVDEVVEFLRDRNLAADALHGDLNQNARTRIMHAFRAGHIQVLVATDVAGRGMDVDNLEVVINLDLPRDNEDYVHRIGRTGRAGKAGKAFTLVGHHQAFVIKKIARTYGLSIHSTPIPNASEIEKHSLFQLTAQIQQRLRPEQREALVPYLKQLKRLVTPETDITTVAAALMAELHENSRCTVDARLDHLFAADYASQPFQKKQKSKAGAYPRSRRRAFSR
ncbi:MAG: DEAD/DEAH box helicase [Candidatus Melainabacteria bacterium]|nr:DEAD/DEAH box helicase [Candidatus Melainabacteria bacterium]